MFLAGDTDAFFASISDVQSAYQSDAFGFRRVLADIMKSNFRRTLIISVTKGGLIPYFFPWHIAITIVVVILAFALYPLAVKLTVRIA